LSSPQHPHRLSDPRIDLSMDTGVLSSRRKGPDTHHLPVPSLRIRGVIPPLPRMCAWHGAWLNVRDDFIISPRD